MRLALPMVLRAQIEAAARAAFPRECCGLIEGETEQGIVRAAMIHPARNVALRPDRFEIHPEDHFAALRAARARGRTVIGCYHSHPGGEPRPSATDRAGASEKDFLWLIAALAHSDAPVTLAAFRYRAARFVPVDFRLDDDFKRELAAANPARV